MKLTVPAFSSFSESHRKSQWHRAILPLSVKQESEVFVQLPPVGEVNVNVALGRHLQRLSLASKGENVSPRPEKHSLTQPTTTRNHYELFSENDFFAFLDGFCAP